MKIAVTGMLIAASLAVPATAHADCGDPGQDPCIGPAPTVDQVVAIMAELTDPNRPAASKTDIVAPGFSPDEDGIIDDHLNRMRDALPLNFIVTNIQPAPDNFAGATVQTTGSFHQTSAPGPIVLANQNGHWMLTQHSAVSALDAYWYNATRRYPVHVGQVG